MTTSKSNGSKVCEVCQETIEEGFTVTTMDDGCEVCESCSADAQSQECAYCGQMVKTVEAPSAGDDEAWAAIAEEHADGCEWVETRAHRI